MAASSCRGRIGVVCFPSSLWRSWSVLISLWFAFATSLSLSLSSTLPASSALVCTLASPFVHILSDQCVRGIVGGVRRPSLPETAPFAAHLIDQVLMKMIPWVTSVARCFFNYRSEFRMAYATSIIYIDMSAKRLHMSIYCQCHIIKRSQDILRIFLLLFGRHLEKLDWA